MKEIARSIARFYKEEFRWYYFIFVLMLLIGTTWLFYTNRPIASLIGGGASGSYRLFTNFAIFGISFLIPLWVYLFAGKKTDLFSNVRFHFAVAVALMIFCFKVFFYWQRPLAKAFSSPEHISYWQNCFTNLISALLLIVPVILFWILFEKRFTPLYGIRISGVKWKSYFLTLLLMIPLILIAAQFKDFQMQYPKAAIVLKRGNINEGIPTHTLFFEFCYGLDFIATEFFFRGFLVLGLARFLGRGSIIPAAVFYVFIHYGKPLGETIGSFFGGIVLGIIAYETGSIWSGVLLHLGTAYLMEIAAGFFR